jgi:hypothetical protein
MFSRKPRYLEYENALRSAVIFGVNSLRVDRRSVKFPTAAAAEQWSLQNDSESLQESSPTRRRLNYVNLKFFPTQWRLGKNFHSVFSLLGICMKYIKAKGLSQSTKVCPIYLYAKQDNIRNSFVSSTSKFLSLRFLLSIQFCGTSDQWTGLG